MLEISEVQNLDHNSGARQHLLALEQLGFTLAMGSPWPWKMTESATPVCSGTTPPLNWVPPRPGDSPFETIPGRVARSSRLRPPEASAQDRRKDLLKAAGTLAGKTAASGAVADVESCRPDEPSQQIAEIRTA